MEDKFLLIVTENKDFVFCHFGENDDIVPFRAGLWATHGVLVGYLVPPGTALVTPGLRYSWLPLRKMQRNTNQSNVSLFSLVFSFKWPESSHTVFIIISDCNIYSVGIQWSSTNSGALVVLLMTATAGFSL